MHKKSEIISVKKVLILTADLSPKWWLGTSDRTGQNSLKLVHFLLKSGHDREKNYKWNNAMYQDDFCVRNCELLSRRFLQRSQTYKHITHSSDNSIISVKLYFVQYWFLFRPSHGPIYEGGGGGRGRKRKLREERRNERHKSSENAQEKWNYQCEKGADLNSRPFSKMVGGNVR